MLSVLVSALVGCGSGGDQGSNPSDPHVAMGAHVFVQFACSSCHGEQGQGGVSPDVPALKDVGKSLTVGQLSSIINHGLGESANPQKPYMPVWVQSSPRAKSPISSHTYAAGCRRC